MLTPEQKEKYIKNPNHCPVCNSENISGGSFNADCDYVWQNIECQDCDFTWDDVYTLTDIDEQSSRN